MLIKSTATRLKIIWRKICRIFISAAYGFIEDDCYGKASTLTFYTLQSIIPFFAALFAIAKGFGFDEYLESLITTTFIEQKEILNYAIQIALSMLKNIRGAEVVGAGILFLLWTNLNLVGAIEVSLDNIWKIKTHRSFLQQLKNFSMAIIVLPLVFVASSSATVYLKARLASLDTTSPLFGPITTLSNFAINFIPLTLNCLLFFMLYVLFPNTKIKIWPRFIAGLLAGGAFLLWQMVFINFQVSIFSYNIVYGAFALIPLFFIWLQLSWIIALAGAEIAAHIENYRFTDQNRIGSGYVKVTKRELALLVLYECLKSYYSGSKPPIPVQIAEKLRVSLPVIEELLELLVRDNILTPVEIKGEMCFLPCTDPSRVKIKRIWDLIDHTSNYEILAAPSRILKKISLQLENLNHALEHSKANIKLSEFFQITAHKQSSSSDESSDHGNR